MTTPPKIAHTFSYPEELQSDPPARPRLRRAVMALVLALLGLSLWLAAPHLATQACMWMSEPGTDCLGPLNLP